MKRLILLCLGVLLAVGCAHVPFQETPLVSLESSEPRSVVEQFQANLPESFKLLNTVVFEYTWQKFLGLGYIDIDRRDSVFKVVCLNPMGVQLFELSGDRNTVVTHNALAPLMQYGDLPTAVGNDIRLIYFDLVPTADAQIWKRKYKITFRQSSGPGFKEYVFAGADRDLVEKNYYENNEIVCRIAYYEYREQSGKRYPQGIILTNYKYGYQLTVRQKELYP
jgi:hypothetical protein